MCIITQYPPITACMVKHTYRKMVMNGTQKWFEFAIDSSDYISNMTEFPKETRNLISRHISYFKKSNKGYVLNVYLSQISKVRLR